MQKTINKFIAFSFGLMVLFGAVSVAKASGPIMITNNAVSITQTSATLEGVINSNGASSTDARFEYGTTSITNIQTPMVTYTLKVTPYSVVISGLKPNTTYYYNAFGITSGGPGFGATMSFKTLAYALPTVMTVPATVSGTSVTLNGVFNGSGFTASTWFEYANNPSMIGSATTSTVTQSSASGVFSDTVSGLAPNTTYYFRAVVKNIGGTVVGTSVLSFTTGTATVTPPPTSCAITAFNANIGSIVAGTQVMLTWSTNSSCTSATINGSAVNTSGSLFVTPQVSTAYTLVAIGSANTDSSTLTINVVTLGSGSNGSYGSGGSYNYYYNAGPIATSGTSGSSGYYGYAPTFVPNNSSYYPYTGSYSNPNAGPLPTSSSPVLAYAGNSNPVYGSGNGSGNNSSNNKSSSNESSTSKSTTKNTTSNTTNKSTDAKSTASADSGNGLSAAAIFGTHFFPSTIIGWLIIVFLILIVIIVARIVATKRHNHNASVHTH